MSGKAHSFLLVSILALFASACSAQKQAVPTLTPTPIPLPLSEAEVTRVTAEEAKAARESGTALIVDVRSPSSFEASHIAGAVNITLGEIEANPTGLNLDKDQWIITYCT